MQPSARVVDAPPARPAGEAQLALVAMIVVTLLWAGNFTAGVYARRELHWALVASIRIFCTAAVFAAFAPRGTLSGLRWRQAVPLALTGIVVNQIAFAWGIGLTTPSHSAIIHALIPVCVLVLAVLFTRERPSAPALLGLAIAVGGAVYLGLQASDRERTATLTGDAITAVGMISFSAYIVLGRQALATDGAFVTVTRAFIASVPFSIPVFLYGVRQQDWSHATWRGWTSLGYMIVGATLICYSLHMWSLARLDVLRVSVFTDAQPILTGLVAHAFGVERVTPPLAIAAVIVISGVALVQFGRAPARKA